MSLYILYYSFWKLLFSSESNLFKHVSFHLEWNNNIFLSSVCYSLWI